MKYLKFPLIALMFIGVIVIFNIFASDPLWKWAYEQSKKSDVVSVAELSGKFAPALGTMAVGFLTFVVAWGQWKTAREKLRLDLYEKRYRIAKMIGDSLREIQSCGFLSPSSDFRISEAFYEGEFLFGEDFKVAMRGFRGDLDQISAAQSILDNKPGDSTAASQHTLLMGKVRNHWGKKLWELFAKYLRFANAQL